MKKLVLLVCVLSIFSLAFFASPARAVEITVSPSSVEVETGQNGRYNIQIYNDYPMSEELVITVTGPHLEWLNLGGYYTTINGGESQDIGLFFYPTLEGKYQYNVIVYAKDHPERIDSKAIELTVIPEKEFDIKEMKSEKPENFLNSPFSTDSQLYTKFPPKTFDKILVDGKPAVKWFPYLPGQNNLRIGEEVIILGDNYNYFVSFGPLYPKGTLNLINFNEDNQKEADLILSTFKFTK